MARRARLDRVCAEAIELAQSAVEETGEGVGEHLGAEVEAERVVTHLFDCTLEGYRGWRWAVVVTRAPRSRTVTVSETALLPGPDAIVAPEWVPWAERLRAGDVGVGDLLPTEEADTRLMPGYVMSDDEAVEDIAFELGVGRRRVMTREGRIECADRWYDGDRGPRADISTSAPHDARCGGCGFYLPLAGSLRQVFGVCGNVYATDDGQVVSADHGCGAHSEVLGDQDGKQQKVVDSSDTVYDDSQIEPVEPNNGERTTSAAPAVAKQDESQSVAQLTPEVAASDAAAGTAAGAEATHPAVAQTGVELAAQNDPTEATAVTVEPAEPSAESIATPQDDKPQDSAVASAGVSQQFASSGAIASTDSSAELASPGELATPVSQAGHADETAESLEAADVPESTHVAPTSQEYADTESQMDPAEVSSAVDQQHVAEHFDAKVELSEQHARPAELVSEDSTPADHAPEDTRDSQDSDSVAQPSSTVSAGESAWVSQDISEPDQQEDSSSHEDES